MAEGMVGKGIPIAFKGLNSTYGFFPLKAKDDISVDTVKLEEKTKKGCLNTSGYNATHAPGIWVSPFPGNLTYRYWRGGGVQYLYLS